MTELKDVAGYDDTHGESARDVLRLIKEDRISVREVISISETESRVESRVDAGEMGCLNLCRQEQIPILVTEDWRALPKLIEISASTNVVVSAFVIRALLNRRVLDYGGISNRNLISHIDGVEVIFYDKKGMDREK